MYTCNVLKDTIRNADEGQGIMTSHYAFPELHTQEMGFVIIDGY